MNRLIRKLGDKIYNRLYSDIRVFYPESSIRNVDMLFIGDMLDVHNFMICNRKNGKFVQIKSPNKSEKASFEILKSTHSILREGGEVYIVINKKKYGTEYISVFDIPFLHPYTLYKMGIKRNKLKTYFPILFEPINTLKLIIGVKKNGIIKIGEEQQIKQFCEVRGYRLYFVEI